jgi:hypothetical protein
MCLAIAVFRQPELQTGLRGLACVFWCVTALRLAVVVTGCRQPVNAAAGGVAGGTSVVNLRCMPCAVPLPTCPAPVGQPGWPVYTCGSQAPVARRAPAVDASCKLPSQITSGHGRVLVA